MALAPTHIFINSPFTITQDGNVYSSPITEGTNYDYIFRINVASLCNGNMSLLFNNATITQSSDNPENVNINIVLDDSITYRNWESLFNNKALTTVNIGRSIISFQTLQPNIHENIGDRLLEVVAHKLFGHGQAKAAINNDLEFYTHDAAIWDNLSSAVSQNSFRHEIYNQYITLGRFSTDSNNNFINNNNGVQIVPFNFNGLSFDFPLFLTGNMITNNTLSIAERSLLQNGPNVGGTSLVNGSFNIPILVKFHQ